MRIGIDLAQSRSTQFQIDLHQGPPQAPRLNNAISRWTGEAGAEIRSAWLPVRPAQIDE
jgi:hypothetical protein